MTEEMTGYLMAKKFSTLRARMSPEAQARAAAHTEAKLVEMGLQNLLARVPAEGLPIDHELDAAHPVGGEVL